MSLSLSPSPSEETCWHIFTYLADQYPQVSPLPRPKWSECLWKRWGGGQCSHVPAIVSASYLKALGIAHLLHELGRGQNLFGEQRPISCTIKLVPLWHWHMEGEKFCGLGRISNDVAWHRYNLLKLMYLNVDKTLYTHTWILGVTQAAKKLTGQSWKLWAYLRRWTVIEPGQIMLDIPPKSGTPNHEYTEPIWNLWWQNSAHDASSKELRITSGICIHLKYLPQVMFRQKIHGFVSKCKHL